MQKIHRTARIGVLIDHDDRQAIEKACVARGEDLSSFIRRSIKKELIVLGCYSDEDATVLGMVEAE